MEGWPEVEIEFGVDLAAQAGAVIAKSEAGCHLRVTVTGHRASSADAP
ncbi:CU044_2847 family protein [Streptomyces sp. NPDC059718]